MSHQMGTRRLPSPPRLPSDDGGFLRKLYDVYFPLDCRHFCKLIFAALQSSANFKLNLSPHLEATSRGTTVTITEALDAFVTSCGLPPHQPRTKRCMSLKEFERGITLVSRNVFRNCKNSMLRFHDSILLPFAQKNKVVSLLSFQPVVSNWCRRTDVTAMFRKLFMSCTSMENGRVVQMGQFEKMLLGLGFFPSISKRKVQLCFKSVLRECTYRPYTSEGANGLSYLSFVECICRCVSIGMDAHKRKKITSRNVNLIADAIEHAGAACVMRHGIAIHFSAGVEVKKVFSNPKYESLIDFTDGKKQNNLTLRNLCDDEAKEDCEENVAPTFKELLRKMPPRPASTKAVPKRQVLGARHRYNAVMDDWELTPKPSSASNSPVSAKTSPKQSSPRRGTPRKRHSGGMVSKEEYDIVVAKLRALEEALDMDLEELDWDGTLDDAETKLKELIPGIMSEDPDEQAEAQRNFEVFDKIIRNHADYKQREQEKFAKWKDDNDEKNQKARETLRERFPESIANGGVTKQELVEKHGLTHAVARRLFSTKILRFVHMEPDQIAKIHVADLTGAYAPQGLDITETRAVYASLPEEFAVDGDGRKAAWRKSIQDNLITLSALEEKGELNANQAEHPAYRAKPGPIGSSAKAKKPGAASGGKPLNFLEEMKAKRGRSQSVCEASPDAPNSLEAMEQGGDSGIRKSFLAELTDKKVNESPPVRARSQSLGGPDCADSPKNMKSKPKTGLPKQGGFMTGLQHALKLRKRQVDGEDASDDETETKKEPETPIRRLTFLSPPKQKNNEVSKSPKAKPKTGKERKTSLIDELSSVLARRRDSKPEI